MQVIKKFQRIKYTHPYAKSKMHIGQGFSKGTPGLNAPNK